MAFGKIFLAGHGTRRVVPSGRDSSILPSRVANHSAGFDYHVKAGVNVKAVLTSLNTTFLPISR